MLQHYCAQSSKVLVYHLRQTEIAVRSLFVSHVNLDSVYLLRKFSERERESPNENKFGARIAYCDITMLNILCSSSSSSDASGCFVSFKHVLIHNSYD